ncbi:MAG: luciferase family protein [Boseongicola sp.]
MTVMRIFRYILVAVLAATSSASAENGTLPMRETPIPRTTDGVPHVQIGVEPIPEISAELLKRVAEIPGVGIRNTIVSLPGALGFWIDEEIALARPEVIVGGREFAHLHPDGSLHASLDPALSDQAIHAGWAVSHPWAKQRPGWDGFVMIFTPTTSEELDVVFALIVDSYEFVTGSDTGLN